MEQGPVPALAPPGGDRGRAPGPVGGHRVIYVNSHIWIISMARARGSAVAPKQPTKIELGIGNSYNENITDFSIFCVLFRSILSVKMCILLLKIATFWLPSTLQEV